MKIPTSSNIILEIRTLRGDNQNDFAVLLGVSRSLIALLETGRRDMAQLGREPRYILMKLARAIPERERSHSLQKWMDATAKYFEEKPLGGALL